MLRFTSPTIVGMNQKTVGEFFMLGFRGTKLPSWLLEFEKRFGLGGVILFDYNCQTKTYDNNIHSIEQVRDLCAQISSLKSKPLIFVDQEGGKVRRLKDKLGFKTLPSALKFNTLSREEKREVVEASFLEMRQLGIHYNLAPVIDLNFNPKNPDIGAVERSFSVKPNDVREAVSVINRVARSVNLGLCLKHYPGMGGAKVNSHEELTDISVTLNESQMNLFYELGNQIWGNGILVSHGIVNQWEKDKPISMSKVGVAQLRNKCANALIISDDLQMQGLQKAYGSQSACVMGIKAGLDLLILGNNLMAEDEKVIGYAENLAKELEGDAELAKLGQSALRRITREKTRAYQNSKMTKEKTTVNIAP